MSRQGYVGRTFRSAARPPEDDKGGKMGFLEHLDELRTRLVRSCLAVLAGMAVAFVFIDRMATFIEGALLRGLPPGSALVYVRPGEAFSFYFDLALIGGIVIAAPLVMYQVWRFIAPALYANEKRFVVPFILLTTIGTLSGAAFSHYLLFPSMMKFFADFQSARMTFLPRIEDTFGIYKTTLLSMVIVFQMPTLVFFLAKMKLVTARFMGRHLKHAVLGIFIVAAILTPDGSPGNQLVTALPMIGLYLISIGIAFLVAPKAGRKTSPNGAAGLRLVVGAMVLDQALKGVTPGRRP